MIIQIQLQPLLSPHPLPPKNPPSLPPQQQRRSKMMIMHEHPPPFPPKFDSKSPLQPQPQEVADKSLILISLHNFRIVYIIQGIGKC